jgi:nucleotide-binding universal stress UspA family protein
MSEKQVVVPVALRATDEWALALAAKVAQASQQSVAAIHVVQPPAGALVDGSGVIMDDGELDLTHFRNEWALAENVLAQWKKQGLAAKTQILTGGLIRTLAGASADASLIVMASEGSSGLQALLRRTQAGELVFQSQCPTLSVKCDRSDLMPKNVLLIGKFDEVAERDLAPLRAWVQANGGVWHLLALEAKNTDLCGEREMRMRAFAEINQLGEPVLHFHRNGDPELAVAQLLQELEIDVLALAVRKKQSHWLQGGLALALVHHFHKPIYTYPVA